MKYIYNKHTRKYHIEGYCSNARCNNSDTNYEVFRSEDALPAGATICKVCARKRDTKLDEVNMSKRRK